MITVFTPSFADDDNSNAQNLTVKEVVSRMDPDRFRVVLLGSSLPDPRIANRPHTRVLPWRKHGNTPRILCHLLAHLPDVYFFPREGPLDSAFLTARRFLRLKTALVTYVVSGGLETAHRPLLRRTILESDVAVGNSRHMAETTATLAGRDAPTVYDGIDRRYYYPPGPNPGSPIGTTDRQTGNPASPTGNTVLFAGSFRSYKRADLVVRQAAKFPRWQFRLAGTGEEHAACLRLASEHGISNIHFLGHLTAAQLGEEMRRAQIFFFPSEIEGHPQVLGQAAACGLPCIARSSYHPDYVVDGVTGLLAGSEDGLSDALSCLIGDSEIRNRMSSAAIQHAQQFDWQSIARQWEQILLAAVSHRLNHLRQRIS